LSFDQIWAPWRLAYIKRDGDEPVDVDLAAGEWLPLADRTCFLCRGVADQGIEAEKRHLVIARGRQTVVMLNRYPYNNGHLLVAPQKHVARLDELGRDVEAELHQTLTRMVGILERLMRPEGFNIGMNLGHVAGAGLPGHLHWHIVPRWNGDTNFMPVLAGVNVIPQSLEALWEVMRHEMDKS